MNDNFKGFFTYLIQHNLVSLTGIATLQGGVWTLTQAVGPLNVGTVFHNEQEMRDRLATAVAEDYKKIAGIRAA